MTIKERCSCGAEISVHPTGVFISRSLQEVEAHEMVAYVEKWRDLHKGCRGQTYDDFSPFDEGIVR